MATTPANLMQTAVNVSATLVAAYAQAGLITTIEEADAKFESTRSATFELLGEQSNDEPKRSSGGGRPGGTSGGGNKQGGGKQFTADEARAIDLIFGKFKGVTLGDLENMTGSDCADYGYGDGEKTGVQYLKYLANNDDPKGSFIKKAATAILDERRASSE